jgi:hypothetical protein
MTMNMLSTDDLDSLMQSIDGHLQSPEFINEQLLLEDATSYLKICQEVNRKLLEASRLIDRGLRDDALKLMGNDSEVLTAFEKIDFPYRDEWCDLLDIYGIAAPPKLNIDAATKVNQTFSTLGDLQGLLKNHRLLALARAPLSSRIGVLHALASKDKSNPIWEADLVAFQKVRLQQLGREIERSVQAEDYDRLQELNSEMEGPVWRDAMDPKLLAITRTALAARTQRDRIQSVKSACDELQSAYSECDIARGFEISDRLKGLMDEANVDSGSQIYLAIEPALEWVQSQRNAIAEERRDQALIAALEQSLETAQKPEPIERAYQRALSIGSRLPTALQQRAVERLESFHLVARRRMMMIVGASVAALLVLAGSLGFWIYASQREAAAIAIEKMVEDLVSQEKLDEADSFVQKQNAEIQARSKVQASMTKVVSLRSQEAQRAADFMSLLDQVANEESPQAVADLLRKMRDLAKTIEDKKKLREQEKNVEEKRLAIVKEKQKKLMQQYQTFSESVDSILERKSDPAELISQLRTEKLSILNLSNQEAMGQSSVLDLAKQLARRIDTEIARMEDESRAQKSIADITDAVGKPEAYQEALTKFIEDFPSHPLTNSLELSSRIEELNQNNRWVDLVTAPVTQNPIRNSSSVVNDWLSQYELASGGSSKHCLAAMVKSVEPVLRKHAMASQAISDLQTLSESRLLDKMYIYPYMSARYYSWDSPSESKPTIAYISDFSFAELDKRFSGNFITAILPNVRVAGHSEFGAQMRKILNTIKDESFTTSCFGVLNELNKVQTDRIDPIFKLFLYRRLLEKMIPASEPLNAGFGSFAQELSDDALIDWDTNWLSIETKNPELNDNRLQAEAILVRFAGEWETRKGQMKTAYEKCTKSESVNLEWIGWVGYEGGKKVGICKSTDANRELVAVAYESPTNKVVNLGTQQSKIFELIGSVASIPVGSPIYSTSLPK